MSKITREQMCCANCVNIRTRLIPDESGGHENLECRLTPSGREYMSPRAWCAGGEWWVWSTAQKCFLVYRWGEWADDPTEAANRAEGSFHKWAAPERPTAIAPTVKATTNKAKAKKQSCDHG